MQYSILQKIIATKHSYLAISTIVQEANRYKIRQKKGGYVTLTLEECLTPPPTAEERTPMYWVVRALNSKATEVKLRKGRVSYRLKGEYHNVSYFTLLGVKKELIPKPPKKVKHKQKPRKVKQKPTIATKPYKPSKWADHILTKAKEDPMVIIVRTQGRDIYKDHFNWYSLGVHEGRVNIYHYDLGWLDCTTEDFLKNKVALRVNELMHNKLPTNGFSVNRIPI